MSQSSLFSTTKAADYLDRLHPDRGQYRVIPEPPNPDHDRQTKQVIALRPGATPEYELDGLPSTAREIAKEAIDVLMA